jgi:acetyl esterase/lipase
VVRVEPVTPEDVLTRPAPAPDLERRYGEHAEALVDLHLPPAAEGGNEAGRTGPAPLVVLLHGGFWRVAYDRRHTRPLACALAREGFVVATPEYRRVGGTGELAGGWPTTLQDVSVAMAALPSVLEEAGVAVTSTTVAGHSAGGHLALWLANEPAHADRIDRVVGLAPVADLRAAAAGHLGDDATQEFLGGHPDEMPEVYDAADPLTRMEQRPHAEIVVVHGTADDVVPVGNARGLAAVRAFVDLREIEGADHFAVIDPETDAWPTVLTAMHPGR